ncbi:LCP family protein [Aerococcaceae bacterium DSM 111020]|nr:LCP family protein [Aerococcaceae bacterium DSM 111020]
MKKLFTNKNGQFSWLKLLRNLLVIVVLVGAATAGKVYRDIQTTLNYVSSDVQVTELREDKVDIQKGEPLNVLLIGTDGNNLERTEDEGFVSRSDTLMLINLNPANRQTQVLSIPRDSLAMVEGEPDKINHAYAYGQEELTIETIQDFLQVPIDYYATVDMSGLEELINAIGGIEVTSPLTFEYRGTGFKKGETREVNGVKAMNFARMRYDDPEGEVGRQNRQKIVIKAIVDKILSPEGMARIPSILEVVNEHVRTNLNPSLALRIYQSYIPALDNINSVKFENMEEIYIDDVFYFHIPINERIRVANVFRHQSALPPINIAQLEDPIDGASDNPNVKTLAVVINQYPSGVSAEELDEIMNRQEEIQTIRSNTAGSPAEVPVRANEPATNSQQYAPTTPQAPVNPPVSQPDVYEESTIPTTPPAPVDPPATSQPAESLPTEQPGTEGTGTDSQSS